MYSPGFGFVPVNENKTLDFGEIHLIEVLSKGDLQGVETLSLQLFVVSRIRHVYSCR